MASDDRSRWSERPLPPRAGVGLKPEHYAAILAEEPDIGWFEVHAENYMGAGGPPHRYLSAIRDRYPLSLHGVGLSIGADRPLDRDHLKRLKALNERYRPGMFSEHLAWSTHETVFFNDLLPLPYNAGVGTARRRPHRRGAGDGRPAHAARKPVHLSRLRREHDERDRFPRRGRPAHRLRPAARRQQRPGLGGQPEDRRDRLSRCLPGRACRRDPSRRLRAGGRRQGRAAAHRRPRPADRPRRLGALRARHRAHRSGADPDRMGQRRAGMAGAVRRGAGAPTRFWRRPCASTADGRRALRSLADVQAEFAAALRDPHDRGARRPGRPGPRAGAAPLRRLSQQRHRRPRQCAPFGLPGRSSASSARTSSRRWRAPTRWPSRRARRC